MVNHHSAAHFIREKAVELLIPRPRSLALFGSFVRGVLQVDSDIDLLCIGDNIPRKPYERTQWFLKLNDSWRAQKSLLGMEKHPLSPLFLSEAGWLSSVGLHLSLSDEAWILWDDGFLSVSFGKARTAIRTGEWTRRETRDGGWFWIPRGVAA